MRILRSVGSSDPITARAGLNELNDILESQEKQAALRDYEEIYIENVCLQFRVSRLCNVNLSRKQRNNNLLSLETLRICPRLL